MSGGGCDRRERGQGGLHGRFDDFNLSGSACQARLFGVGGLIHAAVGLLGRGGWLVDEALRVVAERLIERELASGVDGVGLTVVHLVGGHQTDAVWW